MARWEPHARERLVRAALDLFTEQGYEATTVNQIADRAGLTKTTFFRHFPDKREVLFAGQDTHVRLMADAIAEAPAAATPLTAVGAALDAVAATFTDDRRELAAKLRPVIAGNSELQERSAFKRAGLCAAMADALRGRGVSEPTASLAAELGMRAFDQAFAQWADPAHPARPTGTAEPTDVAATTDTTTDTTPATTTDTAACRRTLTGLARRALDELRAAAAALG